MFVEFMERQYYRGGYISTGILFSFNDIARVVECVDDYTCANIITKDGKIHTVSEKYSDVVKKIREVKAES